MNSQRKVILIFNVLNLILLACFFELLAFPFMPFRYSKSEWIKEKDLTFEYNRFKKTRKTISMYARGVSGKTYVLMCKGEDISEIDLKTPFLLHISEDRIFHLPVKAMPHGFNKSYFLKDFIPIVFLCCFGIILTCVLFFYHKNLSGQVIILFLLNLSILVYFIFLAH